MSDIKRRVVSGSGQMFRGPCALCIASLKKGKLWMGGNDYVDCPDCEGTGVFKLYEERLAPPPTRVFLVHQKVG